MWHRINQSVHIPVTDTIYRNLSINIHLFRHNTQRNLAGIEHQRRFYYHHKIRLTEKSAVCIDNLFIIKLRKCKNSDLTFRIFVRQEVDSPQWPHMAIFTQCFRKPFFYIRSRIHSAAQHNALFPRQKRFDHRKSNIHTEITVEGIEENDIFVMYHIRCCLNAIHVSNLISAVQVKVLRDYFVIGIVGFTEFFNKICRSVRSQKLASGMCG